MVWGTVDLASMEGFGESELGLIFFLSCYFIKGITSGWDGFTICETK